MKDKIQDNYSFSNLKNQIDGFENIINLMDLFGISSEFADNKFRSNLKEIKTEIIELGNLADLFNQFFSERGWIAFESMNNTLIKKAIELAENNEIDKAEQELINYYKSENTKFLISQLKNLEAFKIRYNLILKAYDDYKNERYYSCIPLFLTIIDGVVDDINKSNKGFFAEGVNLIAWDSIAGHSSGLSVISKLFSKVSRKTNSNKITIPNRHGILHGKELNFDNEFVASKCFAILFAIKDWGVALQKERENKAKIEEQNKPKTLIQGLKELSQSIENLGKQKIESEKTRINVEKWKPRVLQANVDYPETGLNTCFEKNTPEEEFVIFFENIKGKNFGKAAEQLYDFHKQVVPINMKAGKLRKIFSNKVLKDFKILEINDFSPALSEIKTELHFFVNNKDFVKLHKFKLIYLDSENHAKVRGEINGKWKLDDNFHEIEYI